MAEPQDSSRLDQVIAEYLESVDRGEQPKRELLLAKYPEIAEPLQSFFDDLDQLARKDSKDTLSSPIDAQTPRPSRTIGPYKLLQQIGSGGMGQVWMAEQERPIRRRVALKLIKAGLSNKQVVARFEAERQALAMMDHLNIAKVLDAGTTDRGAPYFVMELVQGISITKYCDRNRLTIRDRLELFIPVCNAVQHAHQKGIIHRDLKPSNILVTLYDGQPVPKVIDFGLAKALQHHSRLTDKTLFTEFGQVVGTLQYLSPEQAEMNALDVDTRTDVYSLGVLLYELLTGSTPIDEHTLRHEAVFKVLATIREKDPPRPSVRLSSSGDAIAGISTQRQIEPQKLGQILKGDLDWIVMKALEIDRSRRFESPRQFSDDIQRFLNGEAIEARPPSTAYRTKKFIHKHRSIVGAAATAAVLLLLASIVSISFGILASRARTEAVDARGKAEFQKQSAQEARDVAILEAQRAAIAERLATEASNRETNARKDTEVTLARSNFLLAQARWTEGRTREANELLESIPPIYRNSEWGISRSQIDSSYASLYGHQSPVVGVAYSADGNRIYSASILGEVKVWDATTSQEITHWKDKYTTSSLDHFTLGDLNLAFSSDAALTAIKRGDKTTLYESDSGRVVARLPTQRVNPFWQASAPIFSPAGDVLASATSLNSLTNNVVTLWDTRSGAKISSVNTWKTRFSNGTESVTSLAFTPTGSHLVIAFDNGTIELWDTGLRKQQLELKGHGARVNDVSVSPAGTRIVSAGADGLVKIWDATAGNELFLLRGHSEAVTRAVFSPDGASVASVGLDGMTRFWDVASGAEIASYTGHEGSVSDLAFAPDGAHFATASIDGTVKIWKTPAHIRIPAPEVTPSPVRQIFYARDGSRRVTRNAEGIIRISELSNGEEHEYRAEKSDCCALSQDGKTIAYAVNGRVSILDVESRSAVRSFKAHTQPIKSLSISHDGKRLASTADSTVRIWEFETGKLAREFVAPRISHRQYSYDNPHFSIATFSPVRSLLASTGDGTYLWDSETGEKQLLSDEIGGVDVQFSLDGLKVAVAYNNGHASIYDTNSGDLLQTIEKPNTDSRDRLTCVAFNPGGSRLALLDNNDTSVTIWDTASATELLKLSERNCHGVAFSPHWNELAIVGIEGDVRTYDTSKVARSLSLENLNRFKTSTKIVMAGTHAMFAGGQTDGSVRLWDGSTGKEKRSFQTHQSGISDLNFSPDGQFLATASDDGTVRVFDIDTSERKLEIKVDEYGVDRVAFSPAGSMLFTVSWIGTLQAWDATTGSEILTLPQPDPIIDSISMDPDSQVVFYSTTAESEETRTHYSYDFISCQRSVLGTRPDNFQSLFDTTSKFLFSARSFNIDLSNSYTFQQFRFDTSPRFVFRDHLPIQDRGFSFAPRNSWFWHRDQAETAEARQDWFSASVHRACQLRAMPASALSEFYLHRAVTKWTEFVQVSSVTDDSPRTERPEPPFPDACVRMMLAQHSVDTKVSNDESATVFEELKKSTPDFDRNSKSQPNYDLQVQLAEKLCESDPSDGAFLMLAKYLLRESRYSESLTSLYQGYQRHDAEPSAWHQFQLHRNFNTLHNEMISQLLSDSDSQRYGVDFVPEALRRALQQPLVNQLSHRDAGEIQEQVWELVASDIGLTSSSYQRSDVEVKSRYGYKRSLDDLHQLATKLYPDGPKLRTRATALYIRGHYQQAIEALKQTSALKDGRSDGEERVAAFDAGLFTLCYLGVGEKEQSERYRREFVSAVTMDGNGSQNYEYFKVPGPTTTSLGDIFSRLFKARRSANLGGSASIIINPETESPITQSVNETTSPKD